MGIVTVLFLVFWAVLMYYFKNTSIGAEHAEQFRTIAAVMLTRAGLQFSSMLICLLTITLGAGAIASELENGMIHAIISRPLRRSSYVLGKFFGILILVAVYASVLFVMIFGIGLYFSLSVFQEVRMGQFFHSWLWYLSVPAAVLCITIYGSVVLKIVPNGLLMIFIYILGNIGGMVEMIGKYINSVGVTSSGIFLSLISPFHTLYTTAERVLIPVTGLLGDMAMSAGGLSGSGQPASVWMYVYIAVYTSGFVYLAVRRFSRIDIN
jgi:ABC-type transport system involved in multi-copper enzyme maturation permease subunit